jgi:epoxyqueuosine reductase QueG
MASAPLTPPLAIVELAKKLHQRTVARMAAGGLTDVSFDELPEDRRKALIASAARVLSFSSSYETVIPEAVLADLADPELLASSEYDIFA